MKWGVLCASLVVVLTLGGCAEPGALVADVPTPSPTPSPTATPTPSATPTPARNSLTSDQILSMAGACGGLTAAEPNTTGMPLSDLSQWAADALQFFASTAQCAEVPAVITRDAARTDPDGTVFSSPLQVIEPSCASGTLVSFWAHYDDDLIFANPALQQSFDSGKCLRTVFFTNSDAGEGNSPYAANREVGIRAAYDSARGVSGKWVDRTVLLRNGLTVTLTRPEGDSRISLLFVRLADGGLSGGGYQRTGWEGLGKLISGGLPVLHTIDTAQEVTLDELKSMVVEIVNGYHATEVLTSLPGFAEGSGGDHPDHRSVGRVVASQVDAGLVDPAIVRYAMGYPSGGLSPNIDSAALDRKLRTFWIYVAHDPVLKCSDPSGCLKLRPFGESLRRQYLFGHAELVRVE